MCGICGVLHWDPPLDSTALHAMSTAIAHRGPDQAGHWQDEVASLGFRRLAIIDLSPAGHQPMTNETGDLWLVYNGEVYNYPALRARLEAAGHVFSSQTDTECILHGYEEWGTALVEHLRGMFAFALWDQRKRTLTLARDRLGIKPLYYYWDGRRFAFASEIKALLKLPEINLATDHSALWDYLTYLYIPCPKTVYQHIRQVPPAHILTKAPDTAPQLHAYWDIANWGAPLGTETPATHPDWPAAVERVREKLREAVEMHLLADVPVGLLLSGGLDSSSVAAFAHPDRLPKSRRLRKSAPLKTFSIGFDEAEHTELPYARQVATAFHTDHHERTSTAEGLAEALHRMLELYDQPFADASGIPTLAVSELAAEHVKVVLSGDGGDEVFAGYVWHKLWLELAARAQLPAWARRILYEGLLMPMLRPLAPLPKMTGLIGYYRLDVKGKTGADRYGAMQARVKAFQKPRLLPDLAREFRDYDDYWYFRRFWRADLDPISRLQYVDLKTYLPDDILTKVDRASMAVSLEVRPPLLDHEFVELVAGLPPEFRFDKRLLRAAMAERLPPEILARGKKGFSTPLLSWLSPVTRNGARLGGLALWSMMVLDEWKMLTG